MDDVSIGKVQCRSRLLEARLHGKARVTSVKVTLKRRVITMYVQQLSHVYILHVQSLRISLHVLLRNAKAFVSLPCSSYCHFCAVPARENIALNEPNTEPCALRFPESK